ncbi:EBP1 Probable NADPH dehydrogenase [Candida maltosa Xu316]
MKQYYTDRAKSGGLLVTEATMISLNQGIYPNVPGIWTKQQANAWKQIVDSVHSVGGAISSQLWALGRVGKPKILKDYGLPLTGVSPIYEHEEAKREAIEAGNPIQELSRDQIKDIVHNQFGNAAKLADSAGFDFIELHAANGYLFEQFIHPQINQRTDEYGGKSIENRSRFLFEVVDHLSSIIDPTKLAIRLSPLNEFQVPGISPTTVQDYSYIVQGLQERANKGQGLAYINIVDERYNPDGSVRQQTVQFVDKIWKGILFRGGSFTYDTEDWKIINKVVNEDDRTLVGFGRYFIANPDLPERIKNGYSLNPYDRSTFYSPFNYGYNTYPFYGQDLKVDPEEKVLGKPLA